MGRLTDAKGKKRTKGELTQVFPNAKGRRQPATNPATYASIGIDPTPRGQTEGAIKKPGELHNRHSKKEGGGHFNGE